MLADWLSIARERADRINAGDPRTVVAPDGRELPFELAYADRLEHWIGLLIPAPSAALSFACRAQHVRRWEVPRDEFPAGRAGYHAWRRRLEDLHVAVAREILAGAGCGADDVARVERILRKRERDSDPEVQAMQDAVSLATVELQMGSLEAKLDEAKLVEVLRRTMAKMSPPGRALAASIRLGDEARRILALAARAPEPPR